MANLRRLLADVPRRAVNIAVALLTGAAAVARGVAAAAIHIGLVAVHSVVAAGLRDTIERDSVAREGSAIAVGQARLTERAARADPTATIFVRLVSVSLRVRAFMISDAAERREIAGVSSAIAVFGALLADHAGRASTAAVDVGARLSDALSIRIAGLAKRAICACETGHARALAIAFSAARVSMARRPNR
jgi:hypothetical protein